jgi:hypothetical protein
VDTAKISLRLKVLKYSRDRIEEINFNVIFYLLIFIKDIVAKNAHNNGNNASKQNGYK